MNQLGYYDEIIESDSDEHWECPFCHTSINTDTATHDIQNTGVYLDYTCPECEAECEVFYSVVRTAWRK